jgi:hypothetical protein
MTGMTPPSAGYKSNTFQEIKSHSSVLYNERMAILFYLLDMHSIELNTNYDVNVMHKVKADLIQIYKNTRTLILNNPTMRATLSLETKEEGVYITDIMLDTIKKMIIFCEQTQYTQNRLYILVEELNKFEMVLKDILQYYHYFIRPDFRQKPDIEIATEKYKEIADRRTIDELKEIVGKRNKIDFSSLGSTMEDYKIREDDEEEDDVEDVTPESSLSIVDEETQDPKEEVEDSN